MKMAAPYALVTSCSETDPKDIIKQILDVENLPPCSDIIESITSYPWRVETKYYTADIKLCCTYNRTIGDKNFADNVHAFVVHFNSNDRSSFDKVKMWIPFLKEIGPEVKLLVCSRCDVSTGLSKEEAWTWCLENGFELVELEPEVEEQQEDEDDFQETVGMKRIVQALHAHTWPNLEMKDESTFRSPYMNKMMQEEAAAQCIESEMNVKNEERSSLDTSGQSTSEEFRECIGEAVVKGSVDDKLTISNNDQSCFSAADTGSSSTGNLAAENPLLGLEQFDQTALFETLAEENRDEESFEKLFEKLKLMKEKAETMPLEERKKYAEQIAVQFWQAIGGDEDEIAGLSDSD